MEQRKLKVQNAKKLAEALDEGSRKTGINQSDNLKPESEAEVDKLELKMKEFDLNLGTSKETRLQRQTSGSPTNPKQKAGSAEIPWSESGTQDKNVLKATKGQLREDVQQEENTTLKTSSKGPFLDGKSQFSSGACHGSNDRPSSKRSEKTTTGGNKDTQGQLRKGIQQEENATLKTSSEAPQLNTMSQISHGAGGGSGIRPKSKGSAEENNAAKGKQNKGGLQKTPVDLKKSDEGRCPSGSTSCSSSGVKLLERDYLVLLKSLRISLPGGVLNSKVIKSSQRPDIMQQALKIVKKLEAFKLQFKKTPRLGCREIKKSISLTENKKILEMTMEIFFKKSVDADEKLRAQWENNVSNTVCGFRLRDKYKILPISMPAMYTTTQTKSSKQLDNKDNVAAVSPGVKVKNCDIENTDYSDESALWKKSSQQNFGKYLQNRKDEFECLKFYHELSEPGIKSRIIYTKSNKVDHGFLSGRLDFLANLGGVSKENLAIECKGTTGDMVGKVFTKPKNGGHHAKLNENHKYCYQVQGYMFILNRDEKQTNGFTSDRAVMVIRQYHENRQSSRDFYWNYLGKKEAIQQKIQEVCIFCEKDALACFLAVLSLIFQ